MLGNRVNVEGDGNTTYSAGRDLHVYPNPLPQPRPSNIQRLLTGISDLAELKDVLLLDTKPYTTQEKIEFNQINCYRDSFDFLVDSQRLIETRLSTLENEGFPLIRGKIFQYVQSKYLKFIAIDNTSPDGVIANICNEIEDELRGQIIENLNHEDISCTPFLVFFVFAECKIFKKPPCLS